MIAKWATAGSMSGAAGRGRMAIPFSGPIRGGCCTVPHRRSRRQRLAARSKTKNPQNSPRLPAPVFAYLSEPVCPVRLRRMSRVFDFHNAAGAAVAQAHKEVVMIVMAISFRSYGVLARLDLAAGKVCVMRRTSGTIRYNGYCTSGRRSSNRHACSQSTLSRGELMRASRRIVRLRSRVTGAAPTLRTSLVSKDISSLECEKEKSPCTDL